ncbi:MAG: hypothetical protein DMG65_23195 [Candidatus Angelobacter sp. Gp1-AA117]|nr:MAG: hypothetical protein DMG65_23195 [Candidatus Angelobacter sp. Gp1-AA117]
MLDRITNCLGLALYAKASDVFLGGKNGEQYLQQAWEALVPQNYPFGPETKLLAARVAALSGKKDEAITILKPLADRDRQILIDADQHPDFKRLIKNLATLRSELDLSGSFTSEVRAYLHSRPQRLQS